MPHILQNNNLEVHVSLPFEGYNNSRFDWTGKIKSVIFKGKNVSGTELADQAVDQHLGRGFYNEFGIDAPIGFEETKQGDWFHKIGVGLLKKTETEYNFHTRYEIDPGEFETRFSETKIYLKCQSKSYNGYAWLLEKEINLLESGFELKYHLKNNGIKPLFTNEYNHNFVAINYDLIGENYMLKFPFQIKTELFDEYLNPNGAVLFENSKVKLSDKPHSPLFFSNISGSKFVEAKWTLENEANNIGISETGNFKTNAINLWGCGHVISPELFISLNLNAGESKYWTRTYHIYEIN